MQTHAAFARGHLGFDSALCVVGGGSWLSEKDMLPAFYLKSLPFALGLFARMILILDSMHGLHFGIWMPTEGNGFHLEASAASVWRLRTCLTCLAANSSSSNLQLQTVPIPKQCHVLHLKFSNFFVLDRKPRTMFLAWHWQPCV